MLLEKTARSVTIPSLEIDQPERRYFIARRQSYHGNTLGALAIGGNAWRRKQFEPLLMDVTHVSPCYAYRGREDGESDTDYVARMAAELDAAIKAASGDSLAGEES